MPATQQNFSVSQGDDISVVIDIDPDTDIALLGSSIYWRVFEMPNGIPDITQLLIEKLIGSGISQIDYDQAQFTVTLNPSDTLTLLRNYYHEAKVVDGDGRRITVTQGIMTVTPTLVREDDS